MAYGGTLIYRVRKCNGKKDHRTPLNDDASVEEIFEPRHIINFSRERLLESFLGQSQAVVNSLHGP